MKMNAGFRMFVVALAVALALGATGCRSGWKVGNPFAKAPKAADSAAPSELDELDDLTPPPESYTTSDGSRKKSADDESLAQNGDYDAPKKPDVSAGAPAEKALAANSVEIAPNAAVPASNRELLANVAAAQTTAPSNESFQTPSYGQSYQSSQTYAASPNYQAAPNAVAAQNYAASPTGSAPVSPAANAASTPVYQRQEVYPQSTAQNVASNSTFPASSAAVDPFVANANNANASVPTSGVGVDYSTMNVANGSVGAGAPNQTAFAPTSTSVPQASAAATQPAYVAQIFPDAPTTPYQTAPTNAAPFPTADGFVPAATPQAPAASDEYSNVYYQQQTTSGGFAPGSVGVY